MKIRHNKAATIGQIENTAVGLYRAEKEVLRLISSSENVSSDSMDRIIKLSRQLKEARLGLEKEAFNRDNTSGKWELTHRALYDRGLVEWQEIHP